MAEKIYPVFKIKSGNISVAIFEGEYGRNVVLQRSVYNKQTQEYRYEKMTINPAQALDVAFVATEALRWCVINSEIKPEKEQSQKISEKSENDIPF